MTLRRHKHEDLQTITEQLTVYKNKNRWNLKFRGVWLNSWLQQSWFNFTLIKLKDSLINQQSNQQIDQKWKSSSVVFEGRLRWSYFSKNSNYFFFPPSPAHINWLSILIGIIDMYSCVLNGCRPDCRCWFFRYWILRGLKSVKVDGGSCQSCT